MEGVAQEDGIFIKKRWRWTSVQVKETAKWAIIKVERIHADKVEMCQDWKLEDLKRLRKHNLSKPYKKDIATPHSKIIEDNIIREDHSK